MVVPRPRVPRLTTSPLANGGGLSVTLYLSRIFSTVNQHFQPLRFGAGLFNQPVGQRSYIRAEPP